MASFSLRRFGSSLGCLRPNSRHGIRHTQSACFATQQSPTTTSNLILNYYSAPIISGDIHSKERRRWSQQRQHTFATVSKGEEGEQREVLTPVVEIQGRRAAVLSSQAVVLKQRDDDLSEDERALKIAFQQQQALLDDPDALDEDRIKSLQQLRDALEKLEYWEDSLRVEQELEFYSSSALELAACMFRQGKLYVLQHDDVQANSKYRKALEIFTIEHGDDLYHSQIGSVIMASAGIQMARGDLDECLKTLDSAEDHFRKHGRSKSDNSTASEITEPHVDLVKCLDNQGMMFRLKEDFHAALEKYEEALAVLGDRDFEKRQALQLHIADMLGCIDDLDAAIFYYEKILRADKERRGSDEETNLDGVVLQCIGVLHSQQRKLELAEQEMTRALELQKRFGGETSRQVADTLNALASVHGVQGHKRPALDCFQQALLIERIYAEDDNDPQILHILRNISVLHGEKVARWDG